MAYYPSPTEQLIKTQLLERGVDTERIICSGEMKDISESLDTVQETFNVLRAARRQGITTIICVSNRLQLLQVKGLLRGEPVTMVYIPTALRDWRPWYIAARLVLIPLAFAGIDSGFAPLRLLRQARAKLARWPF
jgi:uncharacterized SAM-binding protein YcdF (DUF218 family)